MNSLNNIVIQNFIRISKIYRESGYEEQIANFFENVAKENNLYCYRDDNNNVLIRKEGNNNFSSVLLQAHLDMVCVSVDNYNFKNGIDVVINGNEISANGTSLGADQGIGLAYMLTLIESKEKFDTTLEFLFTTEEETTFNGAVNFDYSKIKSEKMINLDNAKEDTIYIGADADICNCYKKQLSYINTNMQGYKLALKIDLGGNSGENIKQSENNAIISLIRLLKNKDVLIKSINGGTSENDIATYCEIELNSNLDLINEFSNNKNIVVSKISNNICLNKEDSQELLNVLLTLKSGFLTDIISGNLGIVKTNDNVINISYICRCLDIIDLEKYIEEINKKLNAFECERLYNDSALIPYNESSLLKIYKSIYYKNIGCYPNEDICHGGNECACISKYSGIKDIISIGPNIENFHTPKEKTYIDSILKIYKLLVEMINKIGENQQMDKTSLELLEIINNNYDKRIVVLGTTCTGKTTLIDKLNIGRDMDKEIFPLLTKEETDYVCSSPWTEEIGKKMDELVRTKLKSECGKPLFGTVLLDCDLIVYLHINDELLKERTQKRNADFINAKNMQIKIEKEIKNSNIKSITLEM